MKRQHQMFQLSQTPVSVLTFDIDFFKKFNDNYGHDIGDFMLKECVKLLQDVFRTDHDFVARVGGEEFVVVLSGHTVEHAVKRAEDVMTRIRSEVFVEKNMELRFTASMGIAQLLEGESIDQLMKRADEALYASKHNGGNRFTLARTLQSAGIAKANGGRVTGTIFPFRNALRFEREDGTRAASKPGAPRPRPLRLSQFEAAICERFFDSRRTYSQM